MRRMRKDDALRMAAADWTELSGGEGAEILPATGEHSVLPTGGAQSRFSGHRHLRPRSLTSSYKYAEIFLFYFIFIFFENIVPLIFVLHLCYRPE